MTLDQKHISKIQELLSHFLSIEEIDNYIQTFQSYYHYGAGPYILTRKKVKMILMEMNKRSHFTCITKEERLPTLTAQEIDVICKNFDK